MPTYMIPTKNEKEELLKIRKKKEERDAYQVSVFNAHKRNGSIGSLYDMDRCEHCFSKLRNNIGILIVDYYDKHMECMRTDYICSECRDVYLVYAYDNKILIHDINSYHKGG